MRFSIYKVTFDYRPAQNAPGAFESSTVEIVVPSFLPDAKIRSRAHSAARKEAKLRGASGAVVTEIRLVKMVEKNG